MAFIFAKDVLLISLLFVSVPSSVQTCWGPAEMGTEETHGSWKTAHSVPQLSLEWCRGMEWILQNTQLNDKENGLWFCLWIFSFL